MKMERIATLVLTLAVVACGSTPATRGVSRSAAQSHVELAVGTVLVVRLDRALSTSRNRQGDTFIGILDEPVVVDAAEILPKGAKFTGHVTTATPAGRLKDRGVLGITLDTLEWSGQRFPVATTVDTRTTEAHKKRNLELIGGGAGVGALVGGLTGGGKGAAVGAGVGAAGGTAVAATTGQRDVDVPAETVFRFSLKRAVDVVPST
jgi:hypothetical protein